MNTQAAHIQAVVKTAPAMAPGAATWAAEWMGLINTGLSIVLMALSIAFLIWRWHVAYNKVNDSEKDGGMNG
jgi:hypothetical protein